MSDLKEKVINAIQKLPDGATYEDIMGVILLQEKIAQGLKQVEEGQIISDEEMESQFQERQQSRRKRNK